MFLRTLILGAFCCASLFCAASSTPDKRGKTSPEASGSKNNSQFIFCLDNKINRNNRVDSVLIVLDKFDRTGAGIVRKVFHPDANNNVVIDELPAGKYYAELYVLGVYRKHFSTVIYTAAEKGDKKNKQWLSLDYADTYLPGTASIPAEDTALFSYNK